MKLGSQNAPQSIGGWKVNQKIGEGSFGSIYSVVGTKKIANEQTQVMGPFALKTESITNVKQMLEIEYMIYKQFEGVMGFPKAIQFVEQQKYSYMVMEKLQMTLDKYAAKVFGNDFIASDTLLQIMSQTLSIIQKMHQKHYLYRDMKPANFMVKNPYNQIFIIDFGLCKKYIVSGKHIPMKKNKKLVGTPIFCSLNTHMGIQQSRRDDIESWILCCLYFTMILPWECIANKKQLTKDAQYQQISKIKKEIKWGQLIGQLNETRPCSTKIPDCIIKIIQYSRQLQFEDKPDYQYLQQLIRREYKAFTKQQMKDDQINWKSKIGLIKQSQQAFLKNSNKIIQSQNGDKVRKINKINFKAPLLTKKCSSTNSLEEQKQIRPRQNTK